ncbi:glycine-rich protein [Paenibacillus sp. GCM10027627]|uniref:glycine-rich protein n=1 Tax=unclassified Paenibacillus TaxID=185978 RepID=UPI00363906AA
MLKKKKVQKYLSVFLVIVILLSLFPQRPITNVVEAAVVGGSGSIPSGGTTGKGGGVNLTAAYRVGLVSETLSEKDKFEVGMDNRAVEAKLREHYSNHFPKMSNSVIFAPAANYRSDAGLAWYSASSGEMNYAEKDANYMAGKIRKIDSDHIRREPNFYNELIKIAPYDGQASNLKKLGNKVWKNIINWSPSCTNSCAKFASSTWNYILKDHYLIEERIREYTKDSQASGNPRQKYEARLSYLDLLISLYVLAPKEEADYIAGEIDRYISDINLDTNPLLLAIDTVSRFYTPKEKFNFLFIPSIDFVLWAHGATPKNDLREPTFDSGSIKSNTKDLIKLSADRSIAELPSRSRTTKRYDENNAYSYGYNGVTGYTFSTASNKGVWSGRGSVDSGIMEALKFDDAGKFYGFMITGGPQNKIDTIIDKGKCECSQKVSLTMDNLAAPKTHKVDTPKINKKINMAIEIDQTDEVIKNWEKFVNSATGRSDFKLKVVLYRNYREGGNGDPAKWSVVSPAPAHSKEIDIKDTKVLIDYLKGTKSIYTDDLMNYPMKEPDKVTFAYNASIIVSWTENGVRDQITCASLLKQSPEITFLRDKPEPETGEYTSSPEFWSEIKQGTPSMTGTGSNESFEAMSGTPTNRSLYFASGGSEFIVDVAVEYVPEVKSTRKYRVLYEGGVPSEFKIGDQAKNYTVPSPNGASSSRLVVNGHSGGEVTATWTGPLPYIGSVTWSDHTVKIDNRWSYNAYNAAKSQANAWAAAVNGFTITHTAASDKVTRRFNSWGAKIEDDIKNEPGGTANPGQPYIAPTKTSSGQAYIPASGTNGSDGTYTITVTGKLPAKIIDGPSSTYDLPPIEDTWKQTITYDYTKITKAKVWKIEQSKVDGMTRLVGTDKITAKIVQGDPTVFYNIADPNRLENHASEEGRLRYSVEPDQHDTVLWNMGPRTNKDDGNGHNGLIGHFGQGSSWATGNQYTNGSYSDVPDYHMNNSTAKDKNSVEHTMFETKRKLPLEVTAISDFIVLQTSSGDQSVMYFEKTVKGQKPQLKVDIPKTPFETQWTNNKNSAAEWAANHINIGSYNGKYLNPNIKYSGYKSSNLVTIFDTLPAGIDKPARPNKSLRLVNTTDVNPIVTNPNGLYVTGTSTVFYKNVINKGTGVSAYSTAVDSEYGAAGESFMSTYSDSHAKVNDIVLHNPVSTEKSIVIPLNSSRDQRTNASKAVGGNLQQPTTEYEKILNPNYRQNILSNGSAEFINNNGSVAGWKTWTSSPAEDVSFTHESGTQWVMSGDKSFEISTKPQKDHIGVYYKDVVVKPNTNYKFSGDISCHRCEGYFYLDIYDSAGKIVSSPASTIVSNTGTKTNKVITITTPANVSKLRVHIVKGKTVGTDTTNNEHVFADDLSLQNMSLQEFIPMDPIYGMAMVLNPDYSTAPKENNFAYTGSMQTFTAPKTGTYTIQAWGAQGGSANGDNGGKGGFSTGTINLTAGEVLEVYVGGTTTTGTGGWNGGGSAGSQAKGGGGASDVRKLSGNKTESIVFEWKNTTSVNTNYDNMLYTDSFNHTASPSDVIEIKVKNNSTNTSGQVFFSTTTTGWQEALSKHFAMTTQDSDYKVYRIPIGEISTWTGTISQLRFDLANGTNISTVDIEYLRLLKTNQSEKRIIVAGGGGGGQAGKGGAGGGLTGLKGLKQCCGTEGFGGTQTAGGTGGSQGSLGQGGNGVTGTDGYSGGGGGGGYYGGGGASTDHSYVDDGGGGGGSGYIGGVANGSTLDGDQSMPNPLGGNQTGQSGNGYVRIFSPAGATGPQYIEEETVLDSGLSSPPESAYILNPIVNNPSDPVNVPGLGSYSPGNFINLDYGFQIYFPNNGDFYGNGAWGIPQVTATRGKGFIDNMDTTEWTQSKAVKFDFNVIYQNQMHAAGEWIDLPVSCNAFNCTYDFYVPLGNREAISAKVEFKAIAINGSYLEPTAQPTNKIRDSALRALHSALKGYNIDVVGRIGNFVIEDTGDFRFSNLFKKPLVPTQWIVPNIVKKVNPKEQNIIVGDKIDIRGLPVKADHNYLNTYGTVPHLDKNPMALPLSPEKNNIAALRKQPMRLGYKVFSDFQTIGNYYNSVQIIPYYYALNLKNGSIKEVDVYMDVNGKYKPINKHGHAVPGWDPTTIHQFVYSLDWNNESGRRNYHTQEASITDKVMNFANTSAPGEPKSMLQPYGNQYAFGTAQILYLTGRNRTFMGSTRTYGEDKNPGNKLQEETYQMQAQRWHITYSLPSSAIVVEKGKAPSQGNIDAFRNNNTVILMAADIKSIGDTYALQYGSLSQNTPIKIAGTEWPITSIPFPVINVYSANKSSADDLEISGTH